MNRDHSTRTLHIAWYVTLALIAMLLTPIIVVGQESIESKSTSQTLTLDSLDSLEKTGDAKSPNSDFSLKLLDDASPGGAGSKPIEFPEGPVRSSAADLQASIFTRSLPTNKETGAR